MWGNDFAVTLCRRHLRIGNDLFFVSIDNRPSAREPRSNVVHSLLDMRGISFERRVHERARPNQRHVAKQDVEQLRKLVELRHAKILAEGCNSWVIAQRDAFRPDVGTVFDHCRELVDVEVLVSVPNAFLQVKDLAFTRKPKNDHGQDQQGRQYHDE